MFSQFDRRGKCEWIEDGLYAFVFHYNCDCGTTYSLTECLDILPMGATASEQPEVLLSGPLHSRLTLSDMDGRLTLKILTFEKSSQPCNAPQAWPVVASGHRTILPSIVTVVGLWFAQLLLHI
jgi:hypothetical protein